MEKWTLRPDPTSRDPNRHLLLLKGSMKDFTALLKKFGSSLGRPSPSSSQEDYNFSVIVHELGEAQRQKLEEALAAMASPPQAPEIHIGMPPPMPPIAAAPPPFTPPPTPPPARVEMPVVVDMPAPVEKIEAAAPKFAPPPTPTPMPMVTPAPAAPQPAPKGGKPPPVFYRTPIQSLTFETLLVGPYNRFAHAAAASVVGTPGSMYNPLFLYGVAGTGKTHMAHAIAHSLCQSLGQEKVILTSGPRFARAATEQASELEGKLSGAKALLVDDIHLLTITEQNRPLLTKIFASFFGQNRQVVLTSPYPPKALAAIEESLKISLSKGWSVDLKVPSAAVQIQVLQSILDRYEFNLSGDDAKKFHEKLADRYSEALRWLRRLIELKKLAERAGKAPKIDDLFRALFEEGKPEGELPSAADLQSAARAAPAAAPGATALAVLFPKGQDSLAAYVAARFLQSAVELGVPRNYRLAFSDPYDTQESFGAPFKIADACLRAGAEAALFIGPPKDSGLASREAEFLHAGAHILDHLGIAATAIGHRQTTHPASYLRAHLDLLSF